MQGLLIRFTLAVPDVLHLHVAVKDDPALVVRVRLLLSMGSPQDGGDGGTVLLLLRRMLLSHGAAPETLLVGGRRGEWGAGRREGRVRADETEELSDGVCERLAGFHGV